MIKNTNKVMSLIILLSLSQNIQANTVIKESNGYTGLWLTEDAETVIKISPCKQSLCGRIAGFIETKQSDAKLSKTEEQKGIAALKKICSKDILGGFKKTKTGWKKGWIMDFEDNKQYSANLQLVNNRVIKLRAYKGIVAFGETLLWKRTDKINITCSSILKGDI